MGDTENKRTIKDLQELQALPLNLKIAMTKSRIRAWVNEYGVNGVYVAFSGGKDSTVLLHLVREMYGDVVAVHVNTGLEYPEIERFVQTFDNVEIVRPKMSFKQVCQKYGYPIISKEVSECVYGARKYLQKVLTELGENDAVLTNERTNEYHTTTDSNGSWESEDTVPVRMGETHRKRQIWKAIQTANAVQIGGGGAVRRFGKLTGIVTTDNRIDARLWKDYRQLQNPTPDEHSPSGEEDKGDSGEHP